MRHVNLSITFVLYWISISIIYFVSYGYSTGIDIVLIGCVFYLLGSILMKAIFSNRINPKLYSRKFFSIQKKENTLIFIYSILFVTNLYLAYKSFTWYKMGFTWMQIRGIFLPAEEFSSSFVLYLVGFVVPCVYLSGIVFSIELIFSKNKIKKIILMFLTSLSLILYGVASGGRFIFLYFTVCVIIAYYCYGNRLSKKIEKRLKRMVILAILIIYFISVYRRISQFSDSPFSEAFLGIIRYSLLPFDLMKYYIPRIDQSHLMGNGLAFLGGFIDILENFISVFKKLVGIYSDSSITTSLKSFYSTFNDESINVRGVEENAFVSIFTYFYIDGKMKGVIFDCFICGLLSAIVEKNKFKDLYNFSIYLFSWLLFAMSPVRWGFAQLNVAMCVLYLFAFYKISIK